MLFLVSYRRSEDSPQPHSVVGEVFREPLVTKPSEDSEYGECSEQSRQYKVEQVRQLLCAAQQHRSQDGTDFHIRIHIHVHILLVV